MKFTSLFPFQIKFIVFKGRSVSGFIFVSLCSEQNK
jgi:hypothetical protein